MFDLQEKKKGFQACPVCGSSDISLHAAVIWNNPAFSIQCHQCGHKRSCIPSYNIFGHAVPQEEADQKAMKTLQERWNVLDRKEIER